MPLTLGTVDPTKPETLKAALEQTVRYVNQLEQAHLALRTAVQRATPLTLPQIQAALSVAGSHPLNVTGLPGTLTQNQPHTTP